MPVSERTSTTIEPAPQAAARTMAAGRLGLAARSAIEAATASRAPTRTALDRRTPARRPPTAAPSNPPAPIAAISRPYPSPPRRRASRTSSTVWAPYTARRDVGADEQHDGARPAQRGGAVEQVGEDARGGAGAGRREGVRCGDRRDEDRGDRE